MTARAHDPPCPSHLQTDSVTDAHSIEPGRPVTDECTQDWTLVSADVDADGLVFVAERALNTGDTQDHVFVDDNADGELFGLYLSLNRRLTTQTPTSNRKSNPVLDRYWSVVASSLATSGY